MQVSFSLFPGQAQSYKSIVDPSVQSKVLRNYILNDYQLPKDLGIINQGDKKGLKPEKFLFDEFTNQRIDDLVASIRSAGYTANRSSLMRHIMDELLKKLENSEDALPKNREVQHSSFYFEKGTKDVLEKYIPFRDRNAVIERFILEEYEPIHNNFIDKPIEPESMRISMDEEAFRKLDHFVKEINTKGISRTALMRDVVLQLINKLAKTDSRKLIAEQRLENALYDFEETFGTEVLTERLEEYIAKSDNQDDENK
jgi:hypothetical protein